MRLRHLLDTPMPGLELLTGEGLLEREISWVATTDLLDPGRHVDRVAEDVAVFLHHHWSDAHAGMNPYARALRAQRIVVGQSTVQRRGGVNGLGSVVEDREEAVTHVLDDPSRTLFHFGHDHFETVLHHGVTRDFAVAIEEGRAAANVDEQDRCLLRVHPRARA